MIHVKSPQLLTYVFAHDSDTCELNFAILNTSVTFLDHFTISSLKNMPTDLAGLSFSSQCGCVDTGWVPLRCSTGAVTHRAGRGGAGRGHMCRQSRDCRPGLLGRGMPSPGRGAAQAAEPFNRWRVGLCNGGSSLTLSQNITACHGKICRCHHWHTPRCYSVNMNSLPPISLQKPVPFCLVFSVGAEADI